MPEEALTIYSMVDVYRRWTSQLAPQHFVESSAEVFAAESEARPHRGAVQLGAHGPFARGGALGARLREAQRSAALGGARPLQEPLLEDRIVKMDNALAAKLS